ncbi:flagellar motor switch protein FliN [Cellulomonas sp. P22]|uniref:flagellar motor switch protein FliN n=1 Tax=Cellulomonas sp. P22 TaxID=3373189 RepID=UPI0037B4F4CC
MNPALTFAPAALEAAAAVARLLPSTVPLVAVPAVAGQGPEAQDVAVVASFVGSPSADLVIVAEGAVREALAAAAEAGAPLDLADALRPALEAACARLGAGVLDAASTATAGDVVAADAHLFALEHEGTAHGWFALRVRAEPTPTGVAGVPTQRAGLHVLYDVEMTLTAEIGRTRLPVRQVLELTPGAVLELDRAAGSPADVMVNGRLIARGEVVVIDEDYGIRITEILAGSEAGA